MRMLLYGGKYNYCNDDNNNDNKNNRIMIMHVTSMTAIEGENKLIHDTILATKHYTLNVIISFDRTRSSGQSYTVVLDSNSCMSNLFGEAECRIDPLSIDLPVLRYLVGLSLSFSFSPSLSLSISLSLFQSFIHSLSVF